MCGLRYISGARFVWPPLLRRLSRTIDHGDQIIHAPKRLRQAGGHGWRAAERLMKTNVVVEHRVEADHVIVCLDFFAEGVGQPSEPAHSHPEVEVLALGV